MNNRLKIHIFSAGCIIAFMGVLTGAPFQDQTKSRQSSIDEFTKKAKDRLDHLKKDAVTERDRLRNEATKIIEGYTKGLSVIDQEKAKKSIADALLKGYEQGAKSLRYTKDVKDPGPPLALGTGGRVDLKDLKNLERIISIGGDNLVPIVFLEKGVSSSKPVGRVTLTLPHEGLGAGKGWGTGFLVGDSIFMTNNHVIPDKDFARKVEVHFNAQTDVRGRPLPIDPFEFDAESLFLTDPDLDFTLIRLKPSDRIDSATSRQVSAGASWGRLKLNSTILFAEDLPVNIIQHPLGGSKEVALQDNLIAKNGVFVDVIRYTTDTQPGSSGSPVFNNSWELVALHHAAGEEKNGEFLNNEGIRIDRIVQFLKSKLENDPRGLLVLQELGL